MSRTPLAFSGSDFSTLPHFENQPGLKPLAANLARHGLAVEAIWPLVTFLQALPSEGTETGAVTVVAARTDRAVAYRHSSDGVRSALRWSGASAVADASERTGEILGRQADEPVLLVWADEAVGSAFGSVTGVESYLNVEQVTLGEALARPVIVPRYHPAQLLPRPPLVTRPRYGSAAGPSPSPVGSRRARRGRCWTNGGGAAGDDEGRQWDVGQ